MAVANFIAGDWGTSHLRLFLCDGNGTVLDHNTGPGAAAGGAFARIFGELVRPWRAKFGELDAVLCGMVGSSIGWLQAPYIACPARPEQIGAGCVSPGDARVHIVPGLSCRNCLDAPDLMRGEETQILGALQLDPSLRHGRHLVCLPGTHTKWAVLQDGVVLEFVTALTGELFALLREHSVLARGSSAQETQLARAAFEAGMARFKACPRAQLLHLLFEARSRVLAGELAAAATGAYLSGLLIASDIAGALALMPWAGTGAPVRLVGSPELTARYAAGLAARDCGALELDGAAASLAGLLFVNRQLTPGAPAHDPA